MPAPRKTYPQLSKVDWAALVPHMAALSNTSKPLILEADEYTGEDGITVEEYEQEVASANNARRLKHKEEVTLAQEEAKEFLAQFRVDGFISAVIGFLGTAQCAPVVFNGQVQILETLRSLVSRAENGLIRFDNGRIASGDDIRGIVSFLTCPVRGHISSKTQKYTQLGHAASLARPLIMSAWKTYHGIPYASYDYSDPELAYINDPSTLSYLRLIRNCPNFTASELQDYRASTIAHSRFRTAQSIFGVIPNVGNKEFDELPQHAKLLLLQLWVFQPHLYSDYSIMNLSEPDKPPVPLVFVDIFDAPNKVKKTKAPAASFKGNIPW